MCGSERCTLYAKPAHDARTLVFAAHRPKPHQISLTLIKGECGPIYEQEFGIGDLTSTEFLDFPFVVPASPPYLQELALGHNNNHTRKKKTESHVIQLLCVDLLMVCLPGILRKRHSPPLPLA